MGREPAPPLKCPHCDSTDVERIAAFGGQLMTSQWRCKICGSYFEAVREDFDAHA